MTAFYNQQTAVQVPKPKGPRCGAEHRLISFSKKCTLDKDHEGDHCEVKQCGDKMTEFWWDREEE